MFANNRNRSSAYGPLISRISPRPERLMSMTIATAVASLVVVAVVSAGTPTPSPQAMPPDAKATCAVPAPTFASWFQTGTPAANGVVNPANSVTFPNTPNCSFYQWSKQMFLWATSPAPVTYGGGGGRIFDSPAFFDVSPPDASGNRTFIPHTPGRIRLFNLRVAQVGPHRLPVVFDKLGKMLEVEPAKIAPSGNQLMLNSAGAQIEISRVTKGTNQEAIFLDKLGKPVAQAKPILRQTQTKSSFVQKFVLNGKPIFVNGAGGVVDVEQGQAGGDGVLEAQNGSLVYYATMVNDVYAYFLTGAKNGGISPTPTQFPTTAADRDKIIKYAAAHGAKLPDPNALAIELKTSWVEAAGLPNLGDYITMTATIPTYNKSNPNQWTPAGQKTVLLAMVGMHVVGSTAGHPEMIWATFEHINNAPNAAYTYMTASGPKTVPQSTAGKWLFCATNSVGPFNTERMHYASPNIASISPNTIGPSDTIRWKPFGGGSNQSPNPLDPTTAASNSEVISVNNSTRVPGTDVRNNYFMTGATWTIGGAAPTSSFPAGNCVGTSKLANTTMETYQQGTNSLTSTGTNCFDCHSSTSSTFADTSISHIYPGLQPLFK